MNRRNLIIGLVLVLLIAAGFYFYTNNQKASAAANNNVQTAPVMRGNLIATVNSAGPVAARAQVNLSFGQGGTVKQVYAKLGDKVKQGQVLAEVDSTDLQLSLATAQLSMNQAQLKYDQVRAGPTASDLAAARSGVDTAQANYDAAVRKAGLNDEQLLIYRTSLDKSALSLQKAQADYDKAVADRVTDLTTVTSALQQAKLDYASATANYNIQVSNINDTAVRSAASSLSSAKATLLNLEATPTQQDLELAQSQYDQARISFQSTQYKMRNVQLIAPFDGTITQVNIDQFFTAGSGTAAMQISDLSKLQVTVNMAEVDIGKVKAGQDVNITMDALPDRTALKGKVDQIALVGVTTQGVVNYPVVITLTDPDPTVIKTGMTANVGIVVDERDNVLLVPNRAVKTVGRNKVVNVVQPVVGQLQVPVTVGLANDTQTEVTSGLKEGDEVVINATTTTPNRAGGGGFGPGGGGGPVFRGPGG
jgi:HlyD family secretion protein